MPVLFGGSLGSNTNKTTGTTVTLTTGAAVPVGALVVVIWAADNLTATTPTLSSVTDTKGNTYSVIANVGSGTATANAGQVAAIAVSRITTALTNTDTISAVASSASTVVKAVDAAYFTGANTVVRATATTATGNSTAPSVNYASGLSGDLLLGVVGNQNNGLPTGDSDTTNGTWGSIGGVASTGGNAATNISVFGQYKILTASGSQTYNVTISTGQWSIAAVAVQPAPTLQRTATDSGAGTETASGARKTSVSALGSGVSNATADDRLIRSRTATGSGSGTDTALDRIITQRTATGSGFGTEISARRITHIRLASDTAFGSQTTTRLITRFRTATGSGNGTETTVRLVKRKRTARSVTVSDSFTRIIRDYGFQFQSSFTSPTKVGQTFLGNGQVLDSITVMVATNTASQATDAIMQIYAHTGTFGSGGTGTGPVLATSNATIVPATEFNAAYVTFRFSGANRVFLTDGVPYVFVFGSPTKSLYFFTVGNIGSGNSVTFNGTTWSSTTTADMLFYATSAQAIGKITLVRSATGTGSGDASSFFNIPPEGINWSYWGMNALVEAV